ncbi:hypothetical protein DFQ30_004620, partial [Apophysomyces sp. BC1015]
GGYEIVAGDTNGTVTSFQPHNALWEMNIVEESAGTTIQGQQGHRSPFIRCVQSTTLTDPLGHRVSCLLVCDGYPRIHVVRSGKRLKTLHVPTVIHSMCVGHFLLKSGLKRFNAQPAKKIAKTEESDNVKTDTQQVLMAGEDGCVYILINFEIHLWFKVGFCVDKIIQFRPAFLDETEPDLVVCVGHSSSVCIFQNGEMVAHIITSDWPHAITTGDVNADGQEELVLGLLDQRVEVYRCKVVKY